VSPPIDWNTVDLSREWVEVILGKDIVQGYYDMAASGKRALAIASADGRRQGWWTANEREYHAAYASIMNLLKQ
jgi:hypothetical protein